MAKKEKWTPACDVILLRLRSQYADGKVMIVPMTINGTHWVTTKLDPVEPGTLHRLQHSVEAMVSVMRQDGLVVEVRG